MYIIKILFISIIYLLYDVECNIEKEHFLENYLLKNNCKKNCVILNENQKLIDKNYLSNYNQSLNNVYVPHSPLIPCENLPMDFLSCDKLTDLKGNETIKKELGYGCTKFGGQSYEDVERTAINCTVLKKIECFGSRKFQKENMPCIKYSDHYFLTTLLYSILFGFLGIDRFYLGHTGIAAGKLLTLGGIGIWWIVDIILLVTGNLMPEDGSNWMPVV